MKALPFVLGTDIFHISRLDPIHKSGKFVNIAERILHPTEIPRFSPMRTNIDRSLRDWVTVPLPKSGEQPQIELSTRLESEAWKAATWLAGRWAAKEAARKAWGASLISWKDVRVETDERAPGVIDASRPVKIVCQPSPDTSFDESEEQQALRQEGRLSISHDGEYCVATVMAEPLSEELISVFRNRTIVTGVRMKERTKRHQEKQGKQDDNPIRNTDVDFKKQTGEFKTRKTEVDQEVTQNG